MEGKITKKYDTIIFDLDGTLLNTLTDLKNAVNYMLNKYNFPVRSMEEIRSFVGNGVGILVKKSLPDFISEEDFNIYLQEFKDYYILHSQETTCLYPGIEELLIKLKKDGYKIAIVSNKVDNAVKELSKLYFNDIIDYSLGECNNLKRKPSRDMIDFVINKLDSKKCIYIGDSEVDVLTAKNSSIPSILVTWGFRTREELCNAGAENIVDNVEQLYKKITQ